MEIVITSYPDRKTCKKMADLLVKKKLCACVSYWPAKSAYYWKGKLARTSEFIFECKCGSHKNAKAVTDFIVKSHPYSLPMLYTISPLSVSAKYSKWLKKP